MIFPFEKVVDFNVGISKGVSSFASQKKNIFNNVVFSFQK